jgi:hypothetical protein
MRKAHTLPEAYTKLAPLTTSPSCTQTLQNAGRELKEKHFVMTQDCKRAESKVKVQSGQIKKMEKEKGECEEQRRVVEKQHALEVRKIKEQHGEAEKRYSLLQRRDNQFKHELKKREKLYHVLQDKCARIVVDRMKDVPDCNFLDISSSIQSPAGRRRGGGVAGADRAELDLLQENLAAYEEQHHKDLAENRELRETLLSLHTDLTAMEAEHSDWGDAVTPTAKRDLSVLQARHFDAPYDLASEFIKPAMRAHVAFIGMLIQPKPRVNQQHTASPSLIGSKLRTPAGIRLPASISGTPPAWAAKTIDNSSTAMFSPAIPATPTTDTLITPIVASPASPRRVRKTWDAASPLVISTTKLYVADEDVT